VKCHQFPVLTFPADMNIGEWIGNTDASKERDLSYTIALNYSFGPKFCHTTEHQVYSKLGQPGIMHIVDADVSSLVTRPPSPTPHRW